MLVKLFIPGNKQGLLGGIELLPPVSACVKLSNDQFHGRHYDQSKHCYIDIDDDNCKDYDLNHWFLYPTSNNIRAPWLTGSSQQNSPI